MKKPKLYLYLAIASLIFACLTWFIQFIGLAFAIPILILSNNELKNNKLTPHFYTPEEIKYLKIAKRLAIVSIVISLLIILFEIFVLVISVIGVFSY